MEEIMTFLGWEIALSMIVLGILIVGSLLWLRDLSQDEEVPPYGDCSKICKRTSEPEFENCFAICAYGWP